MFILGLYVLNVEFAFKLILFVLKMIHLSCASDYK